MEFKYVCRLCLSFSENFIGIFSEEGELLNVAHILATHFNIEVNKNDRYPQYICTECWETSNSFNTLFCKVEINVKKFVIDLENENIGKVDASFDGHASPVGSDREEPNIFAEDFQGQLSIVDHHSDAAPEPTDQISNEPSQTRPKRETIKESPDDDQETPLRKSRRVKVINQHKTKIKEENVEESEHQIENKIERSRKRKEEDSLIRDYFSMVCEICSYQFTTFLEARGHYRGAHQKAGYLACCNKRFFYRGGLIDHISVHRNPDAFKCILCEKSYGNKFALADHMELKHLPQENKQHSCPKCGKKFAKPYRLKQHMELSHVDEAAKKERLICDSCGKTFRNKSSILTHIRDAHLRNFSKMCDVCAKTFNCEKSFKTHCLTHTNQPRMQCNVCGRWLKSKDSLRSHLRRHSDTEHACQYCNKLTPNRQALANHILYVHGERSHKCTLCNKAFKVALGLKEHMASHTGESLYTCPYCPKTFNSNGNMHKHRKNVHSEEWKKDRGKKMKELSVSNF